MALQSEEVLCVAGDAPAATHGAHAVFLNISNWPFRCVRKRGGDHGYYPDISLLSSPTC